MYLIRQAIGGFILEALDSLEDDPTEEVVFQSLDGALAYLRAEFSPAAVDGTDPSAPPPGAHP